MIIYAHSSFDQQLLRSGLCLEKNWELVQSMQMLWIEDLKSNFDIKCPLHRNMLVYKQKVAPGPFGSGTGSGVMMRNLIQTPQIWLQKLQALSHCFEKLWPQFRKSVHLTTPWRARRPRIGAFEILDSAKRWQQIPNVCAFSDVTQHHRPCSHYLSPNWIAGSENYLLELCSQVADLPLRFCS